MEPENNFSSSDQSFPKTCSDQPPSFLIPNTQSESKKNAQTHDYEVVSSLVSHIILFISLLICIFTLSGTTWLISRLQLIKGPILFQLDGEKTEGLKINQNILTNRLLLQNELRLKSLHSEQIDFSSYSEDQSKSKAYIHIDTDSINIQAKSYSFNPNGNDSNFKINKRLDNLEVSDKIRQVKFIRSPNARTSIINNGLVKQKASLDITSSRKLELSGNLGLRVHSNFIILNATEPIYLNSQEAIIISAKKGVKLLNIAHVDEKELDFRDSNLKVESDEQFQLCISSDNGRIYKTLASC